MNIVKDTDKGYKNLLKLMKQAKISADIGIFHDSGMRDGVTIAEYATHNEYGTKKIPERSFMRSTFDEQEKNAFRVIGMDLKSGILKTGYSFRKSLGLGAEYMRSEIIKKIKTADQWAVENKPSTIARKGKNQPLIEKGIMWKSVIWRIVKIGE